MKTVWAARTAACRERRRDHRRLVSEVTSYRSPAQRLELELILAQYPERETKEITRILRGDDVARSFTG
jgi:hypothetical protein